MHNEFKLGDRGEPSVHGERIDNALLAAQTVRSWIVHAAAFCKPVDGGSVNGRQLSGSRPEGMDDGFVGGAARQLARLKPEGRQLSGPLANQRRRWPARVVCSLSAFGA